MKGGANGTACELCGGEAYAYCDSDSAFLCRHCDARVHSANFLVARHQRRPLCSLCHRSHPLLPPFSGPSSHSSPPVCRSCSSPCTSSSSSSSCLSTADKDAIVISTASRRTSRRRTTMRPEGVVAEWCRRLGVEGGGGVVVATHAVGVGSRKLRSLPARVCAAAAVWFAVKVTGGRGSVGVLLKLEACSGVPAKAILAAESRLAGVITVKAEGWDEC